jgi:hypothetical protein
MVPLMGFQQVSGHFEEPYVNARVEQPSGFRADRLRISLVVAAVVICSSWVLFKGIDRVSFYSDESGWISSGMYYAGLLVDRDFSRAKWECSNCRSWGALNAHLGKLLIGVSYFNCGASTPCTFSGYYDFFRSFEENQRLGQVPPAHVLRRGRYSAAIAGVIGCLLAFAIGYTVGEPKLLLGAVCAGLVLSAEIFRLFANRATTDAFYNVFLLAQLLTAMAIVKSSDERNMVRHLAVAGLVVGLTASVKPSGFVLGFPLFLVVAAYRLGVGGGYTRPENGRVFFSAVLTFVMSSAAVIYGLNPTFWPSGLSDIWRILGFPEMLLAWDRYMAYQDVALGLGQWNGNHFVDIHRSILVQHSNWVVNILFFVGLLFCARRCFVSMRRGIADVSFAPVVYFLFNYALLICFLRLNWDRYYLPLEISMRIIAAIGIVGLGAVMLRGASLFPGIFKWQRQRRLEL